MTEFVYKGFACIELFDPRFAVDVWNDVDKDEISKLLVEVSDKPWKALSWPWTSCFLALLQEIDKNMYKCWEKFGYKLLKPPMLKQHLTLFMKTKNHTEPQVDDKHIWVLVPLIPVSQELGLPTLIEGSHHDWEKEKKLYDPSIQPGQALMFDARLKTRDPDSGGGVVIARLYDVTGI